MALSLGPVSTGIYGALNVPAVTSLATGGVFDDLPEQPTFPCVLYVVSEKQQYGGLGTKPGHGNLPEVAVRVHVFTQGISFQAAQAVMDQVILALADPPTVSGFGSWAIFHDQTMPLTDQLIAGQKVQELVSDFRLYVENATP